MTTFDPLHPTPTRTSYEERNSTPVRLRVKKEDKKVLSKDGSEAIIYKFPQNNTAVKVARPGREKMLVAEYLTRLTMMRLLNFKNNDKNLNPDKPIVFPYDITLSHDLFGKEGQPAVAMSMPLLDGCMWEYEGTINNGEAFGKAHEIFSNAGWSQHDLFHRGTNIFHKDSNKYFGDVGQSKFIPASKAHIIFKEVLDERKDKLIELGFTENDFNSILEIVTNQDKRDIERYKQDNLKREENKEHPIQLRLFKKYYLKLVDKDDTFEDWDKLEKYFEDSQQELKLVTPEIAKVVNHILELHFNKNNTSSEIVNQYKEKIQQEYLPIIKEHENNALLRRYFPYITSNLDELYKIAGL